MHKAPSMYIRVRRGRVDKKVRKKEKVEDRKNGKKESLGVLVM